MDEIYLVTVFALVVGGVIGGLREGRRDGHIFEEMRDFRAYWQEHEKRISALENPSQEHEHEEETGE